MILKKMILKNLYSDAWIFKLFKSKAVITFVIFVVNKTAISERKFQNANFDLNLKIINELTLV